jgi:hypothetical protein
VWGIGGGAGRQGGEGEGGQAAAHQSLPGARQGGPGKDSWGSVWTRYGHLVTNVDQIWTVGNHGLTGKDSLKPRWTS